MALEQILSVSGRPGLYRLVGQMKNGIIVEGIEDQKRFPVLGTSKVSALEEISIYTNEEEVPLREVFKRMYEKHDGQASISHKADKEEVRAYFAGILPEYDPERVHVSDMAKVVKWYNLLIEHKAYSPEEEAAEAEAAEAGENAETTEASATDKGEKKTAAKKAAAKKTAAKTAASPKVTKAKAATSKVNTPRKAGGTSRGS